MAKLTKPQLTKPNRLQTLTSKPSLLYSEGISFFNNGFFIQAERKFREALKADPEHPGSLKMCGLIYLKHKDIKNAKHFLLKAADNKQGDAETCFILGNIFLHENSQTMALKYFTIAIKKNPEHEDALYNAAWLLLGIGRSSEAMTHFEKCLDLNPSNADTWYGIGCSHVASNQVPAALQCFNKAITHNPVHIDALYNLARIYIDHKDFPLALKQIDKVILTDPKYYLAYNCRAVIHMETQNYDAALNDLETCLRINPQFSEAYFNQGKILRNLKHFAKARTCILQGIKGMPNHADAYSELGGIYLDEKNLMQALELIEKSLSLNPHSAQTYYNKGRVLMEIKDYDNALSSFDKAIYLNPDFSDAYNNRGVVFIRIRKFDRAIEDLQKAIELSKDKSNLYVNIGLAHKESGNHQAALESFYTAYDLDSTHADPLVNIGLLLQELKKDEDAFRHFQHALEINPDFDYLLGFYLHSTLMICYWERYQQIVSEVYRRLCKNEKAITPFSLMSVCDSLNMIRKATEIWIPEEIQNLSPPAYKSRKTKRRIRVGYFSADFHMHPVSYLAHEMFELHERDEFEIHGFSFFSKDDDMQRKMKATFDHFLDVSKQSDRAIAELSRDRDIDIAVDLGGYTSNNRAYVFALGAAPVQINYLGYPGSLGARHMHYIIADKIIVPSGNEIHYAEKIIYMPNSFQVNISNRQISENTPNRQEIGLPSDAFVFCCLNNTYKINPEMFSAWMRILTGVPKSVLWLMEPNSSAVKNLRHYAEIQGISANKIIFAKKISNSAEYLSRYRLANLFLDTFPYNAHTTASDALWSGLPILTLSGESYSSRVGASLLTELKLESLITHTLDDYVNTAVRLGTRRDELDQIRKRLGNSILSSTLFDTPRYTKNIEKAYKMVHERHLAGLPPESIEI